jgi:hypothetical protein
MACATQGEWYRRVVSEGCEVAVFSRQGGAYNVRSTLQECRTSGRGRIFSVAALLLFRLVVLRESTKAQYCVRVGAARLFVPWVLASTMAAHTHHEHAILRFRNAQVREGPHVPPKRSHLAISPSLYTLVLLT